MIINLNDRSLITSYVQIILRDFSGLSVKSPDDSRTRFTDDWYEVTSTKPIRVTGTYDLDTYAAASIYMIINYPNERFPFRYDMIDGKLVKAEFFKSKLEDTINWIKTWYAGTVDEIVYEYNDPDFSQVFTWSEFSKYFIDMKRVESLLDNEAEFNDYVIESALTFIVHNMDLSLEVREVVSLPERVLSYFFDEVVTPTSEKDEVYRIQKKMYPNLSKKYFGMFTPQMTKDIENVQKSFIDVHTTEVGGIKTTTLPDGFDGFKVTGYVDPWTEMIIDGGVR